MVETLAYRKTNIVKTLSIISISLKKYSPGKKRGYNEGVAERVLAMRDALTHPPCPNCTALIIQIKGDIVELGCRAGHSPEEKQVNNTLPRGQEIKCIDRKDIVDPPASS